VSLVFGRPAARRNHHRAVVLRELGVGPIDLGLVAVRRRDAALQIVGQPDGNCPRTPRASADGHRPTRVSPAYAWPRHRSTRSRRGRRRRVRPRPPRPSCRRPGRASAREVNEELFAGEMDLANRRFERPGPSAVAVTKLAVAIPGRMRVAMLQPTAAGASRWGVSTPGGRRPSRAAGADLRGLPGLAKSCASNAASSRSAGATAARRHRAMQVHRDCAHPEAARLGNCPVAQSGFIFQTEKVA
jgi:hypothetical protein